MKNSANSIILFRPSSFVTFHILLRIFAIFHYQILLWSYGDDNRETGPYLSTEDPQFMRLSLKQAIIHQVTQKWGIRVT